MTIENRAWAAFQKCLTNYDEVFRRLAEHPEPVDPIWDSNGQPTVCLSDFNDAPAGIPIPLTSLDKLTPEFVLEWLKIGCLYRVQEGVVTRNSQVNGTLTKIEGIE